MILTKCDEGHDEDLRALPEKYRQQHAHLGWPKHISVYLLPPRFLLSVLLHQRSVSGSEHFIPTIKSDKSCQCFQKSLLSTTCRLMNHKMIKYGADYINVTCIVTDYRSNFTLLVITRCERAMIDTPCFTTQKNVPETAGLENHP